MIRLLKKVYNKLKRKPIRETIYIDRVDYNTYSQAGEDAVINFLLKDKKVKAVSYLDIGTHTPDWNNNTYLLYKNGNRGVCVEADKNLIPSIKQVRPDDIVIHAGVAVSADHEGDFYVFESEALNTFDKEEAENRQSFGTYKIKEVIKVPLIDINVLISEYFNPFPDFLSIDIEGLDLQVLKSLDFDKYPIPILCVETCTYSENHDRPKDRSIAAFLLTQGYEIYADTYVNTIFVHKNWFYN